MSSIPLRVHLWYGAILLVALTSLGIATYRYESAVLIGDIDDELFRRTLILAEAIKHPFQSGQPNSGNSGTELVRAAEASKLFESADGYYFVVWLGQEQQRSTNSPADVPMPKSEPPGIRQREIFREAFQFTAPENCILVGRSMASISARLRRNTSAPFWRGIALLGIALAGGWYLSIRKDESANPLK